MKAEAMRRRPQEGKGGRGLEVVAVVGGALDRQTEDTDRRRRQSPRATMKSRTAPTATQMRMMAVGF